MDTNDRGLVKFTAPVHAPFHTCELSIPLFIGVWMADFDAFAAVVGTVVAAVGCDFVLWLRRLCPATATGKTYIGRHSPVAPWTQSITST